MRVASLSELVQQAGLVDAQALELAVHELRERLRAGRPTSLGRLLVERGVPATRLLPLAQGAECSAVRCDACGAAWPSGARPPGREFPCQRCGALLVSLGGPAEDAGGTLRFQSVIPIPGPGVPATPRSDLTPETAANEDTTAPLGFGGPVTPQGEGDSETMSFNKVLSIPPPQPDSETESFNKVLPLPTPAPTEANEASEASTVEYGGALTMPGAALGPGLPPVVRNAGLSSSGVGPPRPGSPFASGMTPRGPFPGGFPPPPTGGVSEAPTVPDPDAMPVVPMSAGAFPAPINVNASTGARGLPPVTPPILQPPTTATVDVPPPNAGDPSASKSPKGSAARRRYGAKQPAPSPSNSNKILILVIAILALGLAGGLVALVLVLRG